MKKLLLWIIVLAAIALGFCYWKGVGPFEKNEQGQVVVKQEVKQKAAEVKDKAVTKAKEVGEKAKEKAVEVKEEVKEKLPEVK